MKQKQKQKEKIEVMQHSISAAPVEEFFTLAANLREHHKLVTEAQQAMGEFLVDFRKRFPQLRIDPSVVPSAPEAPPAPGIVKATEPHKKRPGGKLSEAGKLAILQRNAEFWKECYHPKCNGKKRPSFGKSMHEHFKKKYGDKYRKPQK